MHTSGGKWCSMVQGQAARASRSLGVRASFIGRADSETRAGKPDKRDFVAHSQTRPNHPAVAVRPRGNKGDLPVAEKSTEADADKHCRWPNATGASRRPITRPLEGTLTDIARYCGCYGRAMGRRAKCAAPCHLRTDEGNGGEQMRANTDSLRIDMMCLIS